MEFASEVRDIRCPHCEEYIEREQTKNWDFIDGETHSVICKKCLKAYCVTIERPIGFTVAKENTLCI